MSLILRVLLAFLPVSLFLASLVYLDSYKLVPFRRILRTIAIGALAAALSYAVNRGLFALGADHQTVTRFLAPLVEEILKGVPIFLLLRAKRIGFLVDAAIAGFAIGTGFALFENIYYLHALSGSPLILWLVRGFGTAVMHGGATAILAMMAKAIADRKERENLLTFLPGLAAAFVLHSLFNHFVISPMLSAALVMLTLPPLMTVVFAQSERYLQGWLGARFDLDSDLLEAIHSGEFKTTHAGQYLQALRDRFPGEIVADMLCYLRVHTELSLRAKGILMMRESGFPVTRDRDVVAKLDELRYLKKSIGKTGLLAIAPVLHASSRDVWQLNLLESE